jgi:hypothetical protein
MIEYSSGSKMLKKLLTRLVNQLIDIFEAAGSTVVGIRDLVSVVTLNIV